MNIITAIGSIVAFIIFYPIAVMFAAVLGVLLVGMWALGTTITIKSGGAKIGTLRWFKYTKI